MRSKYRNSLASEGLRIIWYSQAYFYGNRSPPLIAIMAQMNLFTPSHPASSISIFIIILSSMPGHPHGLFSSVFLLKPHRVLSSPLPMHASYAVHLILIGIVIIMFGTECKS